MNPRTKEKAVKGSLSIIHAQTAIEQLSAYNKNITQEASLGLFHVQENVRQKVPQLLKERVSLFNVNG